MIVGIVIGEFSSDHCCSQEISALSKGKDVRRQRTKTTPTVPISVLSHILRSPSTLFALATCVRNCVMFPAGGRFIERMIPEIGLHAEIVRERKK